MIIAITGTPGTGKTTVSKKLRDKGYLVLDLKKIAVDNNLIIGTDKKRDSEILDIKKIDEYVKNNYSSEDLIFIESHLSHLLSSVDKIIVLRCHPDKIRKRLSKRSWKEEKIKENIEAEILDVILCEAVEIHSPSNIFEINTTDLKIKKVLDIIFSLIEKRFKNIKKYKIGKIDWSEEILKEF